MKPRARTLGERGRYLEKVADAFYASPAWRKLAARIKAERGCCERCGSKQRLIVDHIIERKDGGAELEEENLQLLCHACHNRKTAKARGERAKT